MINCVGFLLWSFCLELISISISTHKWHSEFLIPGIWKSRHLILLVETVRSRSLNMRRAFVVSPFIQQEEKDTNMTTCNPTSKDRLQRHLCVSVVGRLSPNPIKLSVRVSTRPSLLSPFFSREHLQLPRSSFWKFSNMDDAIKHHERDSYLALLGAKNLAIWASGDWRWRDLWYHSVGIFLDWIFGALDVVYTRLRARFPKATIIFLSMWSPRQYRVTGHIQYNPTQSTGTQQVSARPLALRERRIEQVSGSNQTGRLGL